VNIYNNVFSKSNYMKEGKMIVNRKSKLKAIFCFVTVMVFVFSAGFSALPASADNSENDLIVEINEAEPNDSIAQANAVNDDYTGDGEYVICGTITETHEDFDYYRFTVTGKGNVELVGLWSGDYLGYGWEDDLLIDLLDSQGNIIAEAELIGTDDEAIRSLSAALSPGDYYIAVHQDNTHQDSLIGEPYAIYLDFLSSDVKRIAGNSRYETAVKVSRSGWPFGAETVILARGDDFADALAGVPLACQLYAPIILTPTNGADPKVIHEIGRLGAQRVILLGGPAAISDNVKNEFENLGLTAERIQGANRYETAALIAKRMADEGAEFDMAFVAVGSNFADALSASSYAAVEGQPILLTAKDSLPPATKKALADLGIENTVVCGGPAAVSESVSAQLPNARRVYGNNRYLTALEMAKEFLPESTKHVYISTGLNFPDAIAGGVLAANNSSGVLLVQGNLTAPDQQIQDFITDHGITDATIFGGPLVVSSELEQWFKSKLE